jgi:uncharacterized SAM-binding protein YcdF (DUF218 family)
VRTLFRAGVTALALLGLLFVLVTFTPITYWWGTQLAGNWNEPKGDVLILLGGSILEDGQIGGSSYWRSIYGVLAYRGGGFRKVVISGGSMEDRIPISGPVRDYMVCQGVPPERIVMETRSLTTRENAMETALLLAGDPGSKVLVTSDYHMHRAERLFRKAGLEVITAPFPDARKRSLNRRHRWTVFLELCEETAKIVYYQWKGWI